MEYLNAYTERERQVVADELSEQLDDWSCRWLTVKPGCAVKVDSAQTVSADVFGQLVPTLNLTELQYDRPALPYMLFGKEDAVDEQTAEAVFIKALSDLVRQVDNTLGRRYSFQALNECQIESGPAAFSGLLSASLACDFFECRWLFRPQSLRHFPGDGKTISGIRTERVADSKGQFELCIGQTTVSAEDIYLLKKGDVIKLDQKASDPVVIKNQEGDVVVQGSLKTKGDHFALDVISGNPNK